MAELQSDEETAEFEIEVVSFSSGTSPSPPHEPEQRATLADGSIRDEADVENRHKDATAPDAGNGQHEWHELTDGESASASMNEIASSGQHTNAQPTVAIKLPNKQLPDHSEQVVQASESDGHESGASGNDSAHQQDSTERIPLGAGQVRDGEQSGKSPSRPVTEQSDGGQVPSNQMIQCDVSGSGNNVVVVVAGTPDNENQDDLKKVQQVVQDHTNDECPPPQVAPPPPPPPPAEQQLTEPGASNRERTDQEAAGLGGGSLPIAETESVLVSELVQCPPGWLLMEQPDNGRLPEYVAREAPLGSCTAQPISRPCTGGEQAEVVCDVDNGQHDDNSGRSAHITPERAATSTSTSTTTPTGTLEACPSLDTAATESTGRSVETHAFEQSSALQQEEEEEQQQQQQQQHGMVGISVHLDEVPTLDAGPEMGSPMELHQQQHQQHYDFNDADGGYSPEGQRSPGLMSLGSGQQPPFRQLGELLRRSSTSSHLSAGYYDDEDLEREFDEEPEFERRNVQLKRNKSPRDEYELGAELGRGKFGTVVRCVEQSTGRKLAAKFISMRRREDREDVEREVAIMSVLQHKRLLQLYDAFDDGQMEMCLIMELVEGGELFERVVDDDFDLTEKKAAIFMRQICEGVEYMHSQQIVHLDMKPENILCLSRTGMRIKLIDFGLARRLDPSKPTRVMFGTPDFAAPEVLAYETVTLATDMWSVGVICYVLLSGLSPFMGDNDMETMANVMRTTYDFNDQAFEAISELAKDFIAKLLVRDPNERLKPGECLRHAWLQRGGAPLEAAIRERRESCALMISAHHRMFLEQAAMAAIAEQTSQTSPPVGAAFAQSRPSFGAESTTSSGMYSLDKRRLKKYVIRRKWHKTVHAIMALGRMGANLRL